MAWLVQIHRVIAHLDIVATVEPEVFWLCTEWDMPIERFLKFCDVDELTFFYFRFWPRSLCDAIWDNLVLEYILCFSLFEEWLFLLSLDLVCLLNWLVRWKAIKVFRVCYLVDFSPLSFVFIFILIVFLDQPWLVDIFIYRVEVVIKNMVLRIFRG